MIIQIIYFVYSICAFCQQWHIYVNICVHLYDTYKYGKEYFEEFMVNLFQPLYLTDVVFPSNREKYTVLASD